ncbi:preprotein translocase subunit SecE [candidate division MSBL1 archaeon SCGC-AAA382A03]|uniref:Protein translocase subunit SecE n=1 Tax=candidate division MSBL1 archaeon SCGC-AAA382A03 TaxID=1698278 RepID=A0A133VEZ5_9EURY|nr:preprotein translocase subunit SecE [candidate division MSBL1 archaeon SCGC-AAA382A03]
MIQEFLHQAKRVLQVARKPDTEEYMQVAKITGLGMIIIGVIGFIVSLISSFLGGSV